MDGTQPPGIYFLSCIFDMVPVSLLRAAWSDDTLNRQTVHPKWRRGCLRAALLAASFATALELIFMFSYLNNGGGIHGSEPSPGLWKTLGRVATGIGVVSLVMTAFGTGNGRLKLFGWALSIVGTAVMTSGVAMD